MKLSELAGLGFVLGGFLVLFRRGLAGLFDVSYLFVTAVGIVAVLLGVNYFNVGRQTRRHTADLPDVELRYEATPPGEETDELLADAVGLSRRGVAARREFRQQVHDAATETLWRRGDYPSETAAAAAVDAGEWTADPVAAWFLADGDGDAPLSVRVRGVVGESGFVFAARRAVTAVAAAQRGTQPPAVSSGDSAGRDSLREQLRRRLGFGDGADKRETGSDTNASSTATTGRPGAAGTGRRTDGRAAGETTADESIDDSPEAAETRGATGTDHEDVWKLLEERQ